MTRLRGNKDYGEWASRPVPVASVPVGIPLIDNYDGTNSACLFNLKAERSTVRRQVSQNLYIIILLPCKHLIFSAPGSLQGEQWSSAMAGVYIRGREA